MRHRLFFLIIRGPPISPLFPHPPLSRSAWRTRGVHSPAPRPDGVAWADGVPTEDLPPAQDLEGTVLPPAGERAGLDACVLFRDHRLLGYATGRKTPGADSTSPSSAHLKAG